MILTKEKERKIFFEGYNEGLLRFRNALLGLTKTKKEFKENKVALDMMMNMLERK